MAKTKKIP